MLTIFAVPKPFAGHIGVIQGNAIRSWTRLRPRCQVILCGDEAGTGEIASELGVAWIPSVARNEFGTPLLSSVFEAAEQRAAHRLLCYVNADIVLLPDFLEATRRVAAVRRRFLMVGRRWDLDVSEQLPLEGDEWERNLRRRVSEAGTLHPPWGSDYFVYQRGMIGALPPFAVGRPGWDNWMIYRARSRRIPVVDATACTLVIHQDHDHGHVQQGTGDQWEGPEADRNRALLGPAQRNFTLEHATHRLTGAGLVPLHGWTRDGIKQRLRTQLVIAPPPLRPPLRGLRAIWKACRRNDT